MNYLLITEPWNHLVIDDFYDNNKYIQATKEILSYIKSNKFSDKQVIIKTTDLNFDKVFPKTLDYIKSNIIDESVLQLFPAYREYSSLSSYSEINICFGDFSYPIHDEATYKVLSAVTYLFPKTGKGTLIYDNNKSFIKEIEWKPNRTLIFAPIDNVTWHAYKSGSEPVRVTINTFLTK